MKIVLRTTKNYSDDAGGGREEKKKDNNKKLLDNFSEGTCIILLCGSIFLERAVVVKIKERVKKRWVMDKIGTLVIDREFLKGGLGWLSVM